MLARTRSAVKRQRVVAVESALFNPDVIFILASLLNTRDLCQVSQTCKALGGKQAEYDGMSMVEDVARRLFEQSATEWERSCLPKYDDESWIELYRHLLMLRAKLTFDQLVGSNIQYDADQSSVRARTCWDVSSALCSNHVLRSGKHLAVFSNNYNTLFGVVRPMQINRADFGDGALNRFSPRLPEFWEYLRAKRTVRWGDSNVHCCTMYSCGSFHWDDWIQQDYTKPSTLPYNILLGVPIGLLLDLDEGTLKMCQDGRMIAMLKDGLSGDYCWYGTVVRNNSISIERGRA